MIAIDAREDDPQVLALKARSLQEWREVFALYPYVPRVYATKDRFFSRGSDNYIADFLQYGEHLGPRPIERFRLWRHPEDSELKRLLLTAWDTSAVPHWVIFELS